MQKCTAYARQKGDFGILWEGAWPLCPLPLNPPINMITFFTPVSIFKASSSMLLAGVYRHPFFLAVIIFVYGLAISPGIRTDVCRGDS